MYFSNLVSVYDQKLDLIKYPLVSYARGHGPSRWVLYKAYKADLPTYLYISNFFITPATSYTLTYRIKSRDEAKAHGKLVCI